jgi:hypothetical protein
MLATRVGFILVNEREASLCVLAAMAVTVQVCLDVDVYFCEFPQAELHFGGSGSCCPTACCAAANVPGRTSAMASADQPAP